MCRWFRLAAMSGGLLCLTLTASSATVTAYTDRTGSMLQLRITPTAGQVVELRSSEPILSFGALFNSVDPSLALSLVILAPHPAEAGRRDRGGDNAVPQSQALVARELARARAAEGYGNPFALIGDLIAGREVAPGQVQRALTHSDLRRGRESVLPWRRAE